MRLRTTDHCETYCVDRFVGRKTGLVKRVALSTRSRDTGDTVIAKVLPKYDPADLGLANVETDFATVGKGSTPGDALRSAVGEYVERYCAFTGLPNADRSQQSYESAAAGDSIVPPFETLSQYTHQQYQDVEADPLTRDTTVTWVDGVELTTGRPVSLPVWLASSAADSPHGFTSSNGCAAGQTLPAAVYRGLLEVVERHALMRCWYEQSTPDRIRLAAHPDLQARRDRCEPAEGRIELLSLDTDLPFETIAAAFVGAGDRRPKFLIAASARLQFAEAVRDALEEITQLIRVYRRLSLLDRTSAEGEDGMDIGDNGMYYADPDNFGPVERLLEGPVRTPRPLEKSRSDAVSKRLDRALAAFEQRSMTVAAYEATDSAVREGGLRVVKVVVPELAPLCRPDRPAAGHPRLPATATECEPHPVP